MKPKDGIKEAGKYLSTCEKIGTIIKRQDNKGQLCKIIGSNSRGFIVLPLNTNNSRFLLLPFNQIDSWEITE